MLLDETIENQVTNPIRNAYIFSCHGPLLSLSLHSLSVFDILFQVYNRLNFDIIQSTPIIY